MDTNGEDEENFIKISSIWENCFKDIDQSFGKSHKFNKRSSHIILLQRRCIEQANNILILKNALKEVLNQNDMVCLTLFIIIDYS